MISEREIAEKFTVIWKQNFPLLTSGYIRVFNATQLESINSKPVPTNDNVRYDLVSESAFNLSNIAKSESCTPSEYLSNTSNKEKLIASTAKSIWKSGNFKKEDLTLSKDELEGIVLISKNILEFIRKVGDNNIIFKPKLKGYSFIPDLVADISIGDTLYEIKTVNRNFQSSDLKQLLIYLALKQVSEQTTWSYAGLYNPRKGTYCRFNVRNLVYNISGGKTPNEAFEGLLNGLVRDIEIDSKF
ncbi:hypothetical protein E6C50_01735 [Flavobacterium supellecticarium]|uniref:PD-(D/E)XK nuclease superfamily protein n=1 Tax=Flavobacterium supellecticarium TaxID=2565924 RepID=A0A4S4A3V0_9FLAO|nr:hypothetical protein [Flavobacterium supellecticarium]THF52953.1 hypothetical protein E6C50_01735 [Flavobacterium supellecticarium]